MKHFEKAKEWAKGLARAAREAVRKHPCAAAGLAVAAGAAAMGIVSPGDVMAWTAPNSTDFAYDVYDIAVNKVLNGPIGFVTGMGVMGAGGYFIANSRAGGMASGIPMILLGGALIKLDSIIQTLGYLI